ncbi:endo-1,4-beta-xylanase, partial [candidate division KSB1 bacterium]|nr:endo-1,4-beta-xylanase [candidate division KSB1 bacterium]
DGIVRICTPIFEAGYLDGIGMQDHDQYDAPTAEQWIASYNKFDPICSEMAVTELDVTTGYADPTATVLTTQANQYGQLFKCFVERSYFSGRGKIISVSKDGLNDQWTFKTNQSSSLWDAENQCKPAFYAVVEVGNSYNALDSLIAHADTLQASRYTTDSWSQFCAALSCARNAKNNTYSNSVSAADALRNASDSLIAAIDGLVEVSTNVPLVSGHHPDSFSLSQNYPNPFNPQTTIAFSLPIPCDIQVTLYDDLGRMVAVLARGFFQAGYYKIDLNAIDLVSGVYFYRLQAGRYTKIKKMTLFR